MTTLTTAQVLRHAADKLDAGLEWRHGLEEQYGDSWDRPYKAIERLDIRKFRLVSSEAADRARLAAQPGVAA